MGSYCFDLSEYPSDPTLITISPHLQNCFTHTHTHTQLVPWNLTASGYNPAALTWPGYGVGPRGEHVA